MIAAGDPGFGELVLVKETTVEDFYESRVQEYREIFGPDRPLPPQAKEKNAEFLRPLTARMQPGDGLWFARTSKIGGLYGNEGVALVRNGEIIGYKVYRHY